MLHPRSRVFILFYLFMVMLVIVTLFPFYIMVVGAFKTQQEINSKPLGLPGEVEVSPNIRWQYIMDQTPIDVQDFLQKFGLKKRPASYQKISEIARSPEQLEEIKEYVGGTLRLASIKLVWQRGRLLQALSVTFFVVFGSVVILSIAAGMAAYPLSLMRYRLFHYILLIFIVGLTLPLMLGLLPLYIMLDKTGMLGNPIALILIYSGVRMPMTILIFLAFYSTIPSELEDASKIDGTSRFGYFFHILLPLSKIPILTTFVISGTYVFNDYMTPLLFMTDPVWTTVQVALARFVGAQTWFFGPIFAGVFIASLPMLIIYLFMNRIFITGMMAGVTK
ncbi:MAG: carbohydrate ABC transporter permease [Chloroflexi bacterium]|nr:carbohydrate ABC transporter permease [Chloroflexota bacterium]